jgi:hypothetical protein
MTPDPRHVAPDPTSPAAPAADAARDAVPWEMIEAGRYRPRRIRGSFRGRELG